MVLIYCSHADLKDLEFACTKIEYGFEIKLMPVDWMAAGDVLVSAEFDTSKWSLKDYEAHVN